MVGKYVWTFYRFLAHYINERRGKRKTTPSKEQSKKIE